MSTEQLVKIADLAGKVRAAQKNYFKVRTQEALVASKSLEKQLDDALAEERQPRFIDDVYLP